jgi:hypothetical protein
MEDSEEPLSKKAADQAPPAVPPAPAPPRRPTRAEDRLRGGGEQWDESPGDEEAFDKAWDALHLRREAERKAAKDAAAAKKLKGPIKVRR